MPAIEEQKEFSGVSPTDCYSAAEKSVEVLGFTFVKRRPLGWLLQIKNEAITANLSFRPGVKTMGTFSFASNTASEEDLRAIADEIANAIRSNL